MKRVILSLREDWAETLSQFLKGMAIGNHPVLQEIQKRLDKNIKKHQNSKDQLAEEGITQAGEAAKEREEMNGEPDGIKEEFCNADPFGITHCECKKCKAAKEKQEGRY